MRLLIRTLVAILAVLAPAAALAVDAPHLSVNGVTCGSCHWIQGATPPWASVNSLPAADDTVNNRRCLKCHDGSGAAAAMTHSTSTTGSSYWNAEGGWSIECIVCHDQHNQQQTRGWGTMSYALIGPSPVTIDPWITTRTSVTLPIWVSSNYIGYYFQPDLKWKVFYRIIGPGTDTTGSNTLQLQGDVPLSYVNGSGFAIAYMKNIKNIVSYTNPGGEAISVPIKYFSPQGSYSMADPANHTTSVCTACHTQTTHMRGAWVTSQAAEQWHDTAGWTSGQNCFTQQGCHEQHEQGFQQSGSQCGSCHGTPPTYWFSSGNNNMVKQIKTNSVTTVAATGVTTPGAHDTHKTTGLQTYSNRLVNCLECHKGGMDNPPESDATIGDRVIQIGFNATTGWYTQGTYYGRTGLQSGFSYGGYGAGAADNTLRCANVYCHGGTMNQWRTIPRWTWQTVLCGDCHRADSANPPTLGSHQKHAGDAAAMQASVACNKCHGHSGLGSANHIDGSANWVLTSGDPRTSGATYRGSAANKVGSVPSAGYGNCANLYCHSNAAPVGNTTVWATVQWGGGVMGCTNCHQSSGTASQMGGMSQAHATHAATDLYNKNCSLCHYVVTKTGNSIDNANKAKHVDYTKDVDFDKSSNIVGTIADNYGTAGSRVCSNIYCHSDGAASPTYATATWNSLGSGACGTCHGATAANPPVTGAHAKHAGSSAPYQYKCYKCHITVVNNQAPASITSFGSHVNKTRDVAIETGIPGGGSFSAATGTCRANYCHSNGKGSSWATISWTAGSLACNACHGSASSTSGVPAYANAGPMTTFANSHMTHWLTFGVGCQKCHNQTTTDGVTIWNNASQVHVNGVRDVDYDAAGWYSTGNKSCGSTYCHGAGRPQWGATGLACTACHAVNNTLAGKHAAHWATAGNAPDRAASNDSTLNYQYRCGVCHLNPSHGTGPWSTSAQQDGEVAFDGNIAGGGSYTAGTPAGTDPATGFKWTGGTCAGTYCHSSGNGAAPAVGNFNWATASTPVDCGGCHNYTAASGRWLTSGMHSKHTSTGAFLCDKCHRATTANGSTISNKAKHVNRAKDIAYEAWNSFGTWSTTNTSCGNLYCHSTVQNKWGTLGGVTSSLASWTSTGSGACGTCHLTDSQWSTSTATGSHYSHIPGVGGTVCDNCHSGGGSNTANHTNRNIDVVLSGGGSYTQLASNPPGNGYGSCSGTGASCHGTGAAPYVWGTFSGGGCSSACHPKNGTLAGKHSSHYESASVNSTNFNDVNLSTTAEYRFNCGVCHYGTNHKGGQFTTIQKAEVYFGAGAAGGGTYAAGALQGYDPTAGADYNWTAGTCVTTYCHSQGTKTTVPYIAPNRPLSGWNWATATSGGLGCTGCHNYTSASTVWMTSGMHTKHVNAYSYDCAKCHVLTTNTWATIIDKTMHVNKSADVAFDGWNSLGVWATNTKSCSTSYCHSTGTGSYANVTWTSTGSGACGRCHGVDNAAIPSSTGHTKHVASASGYQFACYECHRTVVSSTPSSAVVPTVTSSTLHVDRSANVSFGSAWNTSGTYAGVTCSTTYCHSSGVTVAKGGVPASSVPWTTSGIGCNGCHGTEIGNDGTGRPWYTNAKANSHRKHTAECSKCHYLTTTTDTTITGWSTHINRNYQVMRKPGVTTFSYAWASTGGSCSNISCHYSGTATWGGVVQCGQCHAVPPATNAHLAHAWNSFNGYAYGDDADSSTVANYAYSCGNCHPLSTSLHANDVVEVELYNAGSPAFKANNPNTAWTSASGSARICGNIYCHSNGADGASRQYRSTPAWGSTLPSANRCGSCHDNPPQYAGQAHYTQNAFLGGERGHLIGIHWDNIYSGRKGRAWATNADPSSHGHSATSTTIACYICHSGIVSSSTIDTYALEGTSSAMRCGSCHGSQQNGVITDKSLHVNAQKDVVISNGLAMKSKAQLRGVPAAAGWARSGGYKTANAYDWATLFTSDWSAGNKTCTTACHLDRPVSWTTSSISCSACHNGL